MKYRLTVECPNCTSQIWFSYTRSDELMEITCSFCKKKFRIVMDFKLIEIKLDK